MKLKLSKILKLNFVKQTHSLISITRVKPKHVQTSRESIYSIRKDRFGLRHYSSIIVTPRKIIAIS